MPTPPPRALNEAAMEIGSQSTLVDIDLASPGGKSRPVASDGSFVMGPSCVRVKEDEMKDDTDNKVDVYKQISGMRRVSKEATGIHEWWSAGLNFLNSIVGAGIIGLPFTIGQTGVGWGCFLIVVVGLLTDYSVRLITRIGAETSHQSYNELTTGLLGPPAGVALHTSMVIFAIGAMLTYLIILGDTLSEVVDAWGPDGGPTDRRVVILISGVVFCLPLALVKDMGVLGKWSGVSLVFVVVMIVIVLSHGWGTEVEEGNGYENKQHFTQAVGQVLFAFVCHHSCFMVKGTMRVPELWGLVTHCSVAAAAGLCLLLAVGAYKIFGDCVQPNVLNNFSTDDTAANVARVLLAFTMVLTFPLEFFIARSALLPYLTHYPATLVVFSAVLVSGVFIPPSYLAFVLAFTGGTAASLLGFIIPSLLHFSHSRTIDAPIFSPSTILPVILFTIGAVLLPANIYYAAKDIAAGAGYNKPPWCPGIDA